MCPSILDTPLRLSINPGIINKNEGDDKRLFSSGWNNCSPTPKELAAAINRGEAFTCELSGVRRRENFVCAQLLAVDIDGDLLIEDALADPFAQKHLTIFYTTPSHTTTQPRFRLVFALPKPITSVKEVEAANRSLILKFGGDRSAKDAARIFYGSRNSNPQIFDRALTDEVLADLIKQGVDADHYGIDGIGISTVSKLALAPDRAVRTGEGVEKLFSEIEYGTSIHCPFHHDTNASAFVVRSSDQKTLGLHCSTCDQSFWPTTSTFDDDFSDFDKRMVEAAAYFENRKDIGPLQVALTSLGVVHHPGLYEARVRLQQNRFVELPNDLPEGLVLIKSPKGTGKTDRLEDFLKHNQGSVLLIGHRIALIANTCERLGLTSYQKLEGELKERRLGVCLDSLLRVPLPHNPRKSYETIIIDESEQVLAHFLSETMNEKRNPIFLRMKALLAQAKRVIALDADLGWVSFDVLFKMSDATQHKGTVKEVTVFINERQVASDIDIYANKEHLIDELKHALDEGRRCYVTSNSLKLMDDLHHLFKANRIRSILITSDTTGKEEVKSFIEKPEVQALRYDVVFASPTMGTGVDITFENNQTYFDLVIGFFEANITTHFDLDQQLWRVRHPGAVKVWISPRRFNFDTAVDVVKREIQQKNLYKSVIKGHDENFRPIYLTDDPLIDLAAQVRAQQLKSKNNLKQCFIAMKRRHGHKINFIDGDDLASVSGRILLNAGKKHAQEQYTERLLTAPILNRKELDEREEMIKDNTQVTEIELASRERTFIELFYRARISKDLIKQDDRGRFRQKIGRFETLKSAQKTDDAYERSLQKLTEYGNLKARFLRDKKVAGRLLVELFTAANIFDGKKFIRDAQISQQTLSSFEEMLVKFKPQVENLLGVEVSIKAPDRVKKLKALLSLVGLRTDRCGSSRSKDLAGGRKIYFYEINAESLDLLECIRSRREQVAGWQFLAEQYGLDPEPASASD